jgi:hypothetical protein
VRFYTYIDESGHAGDNLLDPQPFFCITGVTVQEGEICHLGDELACLKEKHNFARNQELKGSSLVRTRHRELMEKACRHLSDRNPLLPIVSCLVERRYMICALIVDNLLDPHYNHYIDPAWVHDAVAKRDAADQLYDHLSESTIQLGGRAIIHGKVDDLRELCTKIQADLSMQNRELRPLARMLRGCQTHLHALGEIIVEARDGNTDLFLKRGVSQSPNLTAFLSIVQMLDAACRNMGIPKVDIIFDSSSQFDETFLKWCDLLRHGPRIDSPNPEFNLRISGLDRVGQFGTGDSSSNPVLQYADFFASGIRTIADQRSCLLNKGPANSTELYFATMLRRMFYNELFVKIASQAVVGQLRRIIDATPK